MAVTETERDEAAPDTGWRVEVAGSVASLTRGADNGSVVGGAGRRRQHNEAATDVVVEFVDRCHHIYVLVWCT